MSVDPNAMTCHFCGHVGMPRDFGGWWNWQGHRGLFGLMCSSCNLRFNEMSEQELDDHATSQQVAKKLTP